MDRVPASRGRGGLWCFHAHQRFVRGPGQGPCRCVLRRRHDVSEAVHRGDHLHGETAGKSLDWQLRFRTGNVDCERGGARCQIRWNCVITYEIDRCTPSAISVHRLFPVVGGCRFPRSLREEI